MSYIGNNPGVASQRVVSTFTATAGQTTFTPISGYTIGYLDVYLNGVKLILGSDYTATDGIAAVLTSGALVNDTVELMAFLPRGLTDGYTKAEADAKYQPVDAELNAWAEIDPASKLNTANPSYTGTLTGGTGIVNLGSGQFYKDADGKFGFGRVSSASSRAIIRGLGTTSATKSLIIENSGGSETVVADDAGTLTLPTSTAFIKGGDTVGRAILSNSDSTVYAVAYGSSHATSASSFVVVTGTNKVTTVDASGNFGLGVAPSAWGASWRAMEVGRKGSALFSFSAGDNTYLTSNCYFNGTNWIYAYTSAATNYNMAGGVHKWSTAPSGTAGNPITFTQAMTLDASGNLLVGTTTQRGKFTIEASSGNLRAVNVLTGASTIDAYTFNGTGVGSITTNGVSVAFNTTSDHRLKTNVRPANAARFCDIEFVDFEWTDGRHDCGLIAHQLASVYPDLVIGEKDATEEVEYEVSPAVPAVLDDEGNEVTPAVEAVKGTKTQPKYQQVNYMGLIARMGTVVQRHEKTIEAMQTQLDDQNAAMQMLASRLAALEAAA